MRIGDVLACVQIPRAGCEDLLNGEGLVRILIIPWYCCAYIYELAKQRLFCFLHPRSDGLVIGGVDKALIDTQNLLAE